MDWLSALFEKHKFARRLLLFWAMTIITIVVLRVTKPEVIMALGGTAAATIVTAIIGILATVLGFYVKGREREGRHRGDH